MKRIFAPLLFLAASLPLSSSAALLISDPAAGHQAQPESHFESPASVDLLNDPEPFRLNPEGIQSRSSTSLTLSPNGATILYAANSGDGDREHTDRRAKMMRTVEAKIKELEKAGKKDRAARMAQRLAHIKELAQKDEERIQAAHKAHEHAQAKPKQAGKLRPRIAPRGRPMPRAIPGGYPGIRPALPHGPHARPNQPGQAFGEQLEKNRRHFHMRSALMHLRAAGANDIADRIQNILKADSEPSEKPAPSACPDCKKDGKACPECDKEKPCPDCKKDGKACPECDKEKPCPDCKKDGKACPECDKEKPCPDCKKDGKACPECDKEKPCPDCKKADDVPAAKSEAPGLNPARLRAHLQARDAEVDKAIAELRGQVDLLRKQMKEILPKPKSAPRSEKKEKEKKEKEEKKEKKQKRTASNSSTIEV